jgi:hypothetical protein
MILKRTAQSIITQKQKNSSVNVLKHMKENDLKTYRTQIVISILVKSSNPQ